MYQKLLGLPDIPETEKDKSVPAFIKSTFEKITDNKYDDVYHVYASLDDTSGLIYCNYETKIIETKIEQKKTHRKSRHKKTIHKTQQCLFVENLLKYVTVDEKTCIIDIGSGKGELSYLLSTVVNCDHFLIDITEPRNPISAHINPTKVKYVVADATTYDYVNDPFLQNKKIIVVAKHFCSNLVDLTVKNIINIPKLVGIFYSPCCFEKMTKSTYVCPEHVDKFTDDEFKFMANKSSWSYVFTRKKYTDPFVPYLIKLGGIYRDYLQYGRIEYLKSRGFNVDCYHYVDYEVTPQNLFIAAITKT